MNSDAGKQTYKMVFADALSFSPTCNGRVHVVIQLDT